MFGVCKGAMSAHRNLFTCCLLFAVILLALGIPFTKWGLKTDDFSNLYHTSQVKSINDIFTLFNEKSIETFCYGSGAQVPPSSFLSGLYRPLSFIYYLPQYYFFGTSPYGYYLVTIMLHGLNSILLFLLFLLFVPYALALMGALWFGFHPSLHNWLGWISAQTYQTELFVLLLLFFSCKKFLDTKKNQFYILTLFLFALNLWLKEATFMLPLWIIPASYLYLRFLRIPKDISRDPMVRDGATHLLTTNGSNNTAHPEEPAGRLEGLTTNTSKSLLLSMGFWFISISYFATRALVFGFASSGNAGNLTFELSWTSFITRQKARLFDFVSYISDLLGLCWLPNNNQLLKGFIIASITLSLLALFYTSNKKRLLLFLYASTLLFSWPALLMHYQPRYIYLAIPFFTLAVLVSFDKLRTSGRKLRTSGRKLRTSVHRKLFTTYNNYATTTTNPNPATARPELSTARPELVEGYERKIQNQPMFMLLASILIIYNALFLIKTLKTREQALHKVTSSFTDLLRDNRIQKKPLYFFALPHHWFAMCVAQAVWFLSGKDHYPVYHNGVIIEVAEFYSYLHSPVTDKPYLKITPTPDGFLLQSLDINRLWLCDRQPPLKKDTLHVIINQSILNQNPIFITWDYQRAQFIIINHQNVTIV